MQNGRKTDNIALQGSDELAQPWSPWPSNMLRHAWHNIYSASLLHDGQPQLRSAANDLWHVCQPLNLTACC